ncbi:hypothetical protein [Enterococcus sp. BWR-S5]|uniref:hypothetical protein n=1 Tax=Enterococcus sp. BWR-S5 TaxID=2787714 RepID=UPI001920D777|nr:hypothetical protein [Enterococcus sp. BWR-S5]MBL1227236.1 hypothetical protein [Enterococcus sp. BWR-S5]
MNNSIMNFPNRGKWGKSGYRGNCSGYVIKELLEHYYPSKAPKHFLEVFSGGGTGKDVAKELGLQNSTHLDLINGWNALTDELPKGSDFTFSHPPYWDIIKYESQRGQYSEDDLSNNMSYEDFIKKLDRVNEKIYHNLLNGGRHAFLVGDVRKNNKYYSIQKDMTWFGDLESHIIKVQHNCMSDKNSYKKSNIIFITHEHLLIFKKNSIWNVPIKYTKDFLYELKKMVNVTWKNLIQAALEHLNQATVSDIYQLLQDSEKGKNNNHIREKIRQTLNNSECFKKNEDYWELAV